MADQQIQISDLKFDSIKTSLVSYMKSKDIFKDYDFEGSAIRTLIDLLAYNTFYYGYYSNMIANEMFLDTAKLEDSLISLTKPLGYLLSNSASSYTNVRMTNLSGTTDKISAFSKFFGYDSTGNRFDFYNIRDIPVKNIITGQASSFGTDFFAVYESKYLTYRQQVDVDFNKQEVLLVGKEIDPRTIVVEVENDGVIERWENYLVNPDLITGPESKIFFLERKRNGYMVLFGKMSETDESFSSVGKQIGDGDTVLISFLTSSGDISNNINTMNFESDISGASVATTTLDVVTLFPTKNGRSTPDLDAVRFFAPKSFASQNRLVTKGDYYAILNQLGYGSGNDPDFDFKVFGGEEATPPYYGRVFVSIIDLNPQDLQDFTEINQINEVMSVLKSKSVVTVLPEYVSPVEIPMKLTITAIISGASQSTISSRLTLIKNALNNAYGIKKFNTNFIEEDIKDVIRSVSPGIIINDNNIALYSEYETTKGGENKIINIKNPISTFDLGNVQISWTDSNVRDVYENKKLYRYDKNNDELISTDAVGEVDYEQGIITLYQNLGANPSPFKIQVRARDDVFYAKDEFIAYLPPSNLSLTINSA